MVRFILRDLGNGKMGTEEIWKLTSLGKKRASSIYSSESSNSIVSYLHQNKTASVHELAGATGRPTSSILTRLRKLERNGLAERFGGY